MQAAAYHGVRTAAYRPLEALRQTDRHKHMKAGRRFGSHAPLSNFTAPPFEIKA